MDRRVYAGAVRIAYLVVLVLAIGVDAQSIYACWGGCYNKCNIRTGKSDTKTELSCDYKCLKSCIPHTANDMKSYCQIGCSMKRCIPLSIDAAKMGTCFGWCTKLCNKVVVP